jgi:hypothetical protein
MITKNLSKKEISETFKKIKNQQSEIQKYYDFLYEKENNYLFLEQKDIWIISDSSTLFTNFKIQNYTPITYS